MSVRQMLIAAVLLGMPVSAHAQAAGGDPQGDLFGGYSYLRSDDLNLHGGMLALGWNFTGRLGGVLEVARHWGSSEDEDVTSASYLLGWRYWLAKGSYRPFVQVSVGLVQTTRGISIFDIDITETDSGYGLAAGLGLDIGLGDRWAIRVQGDYRYANADSQSFNEFRGSVGAVLRFGSR